MHKTVALGVGIANAPEPRHSVHLTFPIDAESDVRLLENGNRVSVVLVNAVTRDKAIRIARGMLQEALRALNHLSPE